MARKDRLSRLQRAEILAGICTEPLTLDEILAKAPHLSRSTTHRILKDHPGFIYVNSPFVPMRYAFDPTVDASSWIYGPQIENLAEQQKELNNRLAESAKQPKHSIPDDLIPTSPLDIIHFAQRVKLYAEDVETRLNAIFDLVLKCQKFNRGMDTEPLPPVDEALMPIKELRILAAGIYYRTTQMLNELDTEDYYLRIPNAN